MIRFVQAVSLVRVLDMLEATRKSQSTDVAWIGIEPVLSPLEIYQPPARLVVKIPDTVAPQDIADAQSWHPVRTLPSHLPSEHAAQAIADFVQALYVDRVNTWTLIVHCTMGLSRSPAVALWVQECFKPMREKTFRSLHPLVTPNPTLLRLLRKRGGSWRREDQSN